MTSRSVSRQRNRVVVPGSEATRNRDQQPFYRASVRHPASVNNGICWSFRTPTSSVQSRDMWLIRPDDKRISEHRTSDLPERIQRREGAHAELRSRIEAERHIRVFRGADRWSGANSRRSSMARSRTLLRRCAHRFRADARRPRARACRMALFGRHFHA
jgi:hypothetical protein